MEEEWEKKPEEERWKYKLELEQLKGEVGRGNRDRKSLEEKVKKEQEDQKQLKEAKARLECAEMDGIRKKSF